MSTRCNVVIKDRRSFLWFYRHSDGYPEGAMPTLEKFMKWVKEGKIRANVSQSSGWLILIGADEYKMTGKFEGDKYVEVEKKNILEPGNDELSDWKCGAYEPTNGLHGDIEYLYILDLEKKEIRQYEDDFEKVVKELKVGG